MDSDMCRVSVGWALCRSVGLLIEATAEGDKARESLTTGLCISVTLHPPPGCLWHSGTLILAKHASMSGNFV